MVVLDTNILVAALWSRNGASFQLLKRAISGELEFAVSVALALEYEAVLQRQSFRDGSWATNSELEAVLDALCAEAHKINPIRTRVRPVLKDVDDEMVLECAIQSGAEYIVTMNGRDFRPAEALYRICTETPGACLNRIARSKSA